MALPVSIANTKLPGSNYYCGPFKSAAGNIYIVLLDTTNSKIHVFKATDPTSSFSEVDSANIPAQALTTTSGILWVHPDGDTLHIVAGNATTSPAYKFHQFSMSSDAWSATIKDKAVLSPSLAAAAAACCAVAMRSDGSIVVLCTGQREVLMATNYDRVVYVISTDGGSTWSGATGVSATGLKVQQYSTVIVVGASDRLHFFYKDSSNKTFHRSLSSANALDTEAQVGTDSAGVRATWTPGVSYVSGANTVVKAAYYNSVNKLTQARFNSGANPTINTNANFSDATVKSQNQSSVACGAVDATDTHYVWADGTNTNLMHDKQADGGAFGTDVNEFAGVVNRVSARVYVRGGNYVIAYVVDDNGTIKYNEIVLRAATVITEADGASAGAATTDAAAASVIPTVTAAAGVAAVDMASAVVLPGDGVIAGVAVATAIAAAFFAGSTACDGVATVDGISSVIAGVVGSSDGISSVTIEAAIINSAVGTSAGVSIVSADSSSVIVTAFASVGGSTASATVIILFSGDGVASGLGSVNGVSGALAASIAEAAGEALTNAVSSAIANVDFSADGFGDVIGEGGALIEAIASASGSALAEAFSKAGITAAPTKKTVRLLVTPPRLPSRPRQDELASWAGQLIAELNRFFTQADMTLADQRLFGRVTKQTVAEGFTIDPAGYYVELFANGSVSSDPLIPVTPGTAGQSLVIENRSEFPITIHSSIYNRLNSDCVLTPFSTLTIRWNGENWSEVARSINSVV